MAGVELATAYVSLVTTTKGIQGDVTKELGGVPDQFEQTGKKSGGKFATGTKIAMAAGAGLATGIALMFKTGVTEQADYLRGSAQLAAGIKSTGGAAGTTVKGMEALAGSIQNYSGQTDDSIVGAENLLLTFTNIKNAGPNKIFDLATIAAADMAAKLGGEASSQAMVLGKALNDPVKGVAALTRVGVTFTDKQKATIAALVKTGDTAGAQKVILNELSTEFGGAAKAAGESLPGQLTRAKRSFEDVSQSVMASLMPALTAGADMLTNNVLPAFSAVVSFFTSGSTAAKVVGGAIAAVTAILVIHKVAATAVSAALKVWKAITVTSTAVQWLFNASLFGCPILLIVLGIAALVAGVVLAYKKVGWFRDLVDGAFRLIKGAISAVVDWVTDNWPLLFTILTGPIGLAVKLIMTHWDDLKGAGEALWNALKSAFRWIVMSFLNLVGSIIHGAASAFGWLPGLGGKLKKAATAFDGLKADVNEALGGIDNQGVNAKIADTQGKIDAIKQNVLPKLDLDKTNAVAKVTAAQTAINSIKQGTAPGVDANTVSGKAKIAALQLVIDRTKQTTIPAIDAATAAANTKIAALQTNVNNLTGKNVPVTLTVTQAFANAASLAIYNAAHPKAPLYGPVMKAKGGPVTKGQPYIVGENNAELFIPNQNGHILPRVPSPTRPGGQAGAGGAIVNVYPRQGQSEYEIGVVAGRELGWMARTA